MGPCSEVLIQAIHGVWHTWSSAVPKETISAASIHEVPPLNRWGLSVDEDNYVPFKPVSERVTTVGRG